VCVYLLRSQKAQKKQIGSLVDGEIGRGAGVVRAEDVLLHEAAQLFHADAQELSGFVFGELSFLRSRQKHKIPMPGALEILGSPRRATNPV
jgi:hypothetical protein